MTAYRHPLNPVRAALWTDLDNGRRCDSALDRTRLHLEEAGLEANDWLPYCERFGGYCDCEVRFNVAATDDDDV
jgi:hypothetical protein